MTGSGARALLTGGVALLVLLAGTDIIAIARGGVGSPGPVLLATLIPMLLIILFHARHLLRGVLAVPEMSLLLGLCVLSYQWSYEPAATLERAVPLLVTSAFAIMLGSLLSLRSLLLVLAVYGAVMVLACLAAIGIFPAARGVPPWEDTWNGIFNHKNGLGGAALLAGILTGAGAALTRGPARWLFLCALLLAAFLLLQSESRTSQVVAVFTFAAWAASRGMPRLPSVWAALYLGTVVATVFLIWGLIASGVINPVFDLLERKPTLSGRIPLWSLLVPSLLREFWLGYGYMGFWNPDSLRVLALANSPELRFSPFYSHNGAIETWLNLGVVGLSLLVAGLIRVFGGAMACLMRIGRTPELFWLFLLLMGFVMLNVTESFVLTRSDHVWMIFLALAVRTSILARSVAAEPAPVRELRARDALPAGAA